jgi:hypothetical protein
MAGLLGALGKGENENSSGSVSTDDASKNIKVESVVGPTLTSETSPGIVIFSFSLKQHKK